MNHASTQSRSDHAEYTRAVAPHVPKLRRTALRMTRSESDADDLMQETLTRAFTFWHRFDPGTNERAWLHRILVNTFISGYRRKQREREVLRDVSRQDTPWTRTVAAAPEPGARQVSDEVLEALEALPDNFREAVELVDLEGLSYQEAAQRASRPVGTIMSRLHRGRKALAASLRTYAMAEGVLAAVPA